MKNIEYLHHLLKGSRRHIFPVLIFESDVLSEKYLRIIAKANKWINPIPTIWMLAGFLQIQNCINIVLMKNWNQRVLLDYLCRWALHCEDVLRYPVRMKTNYCIRLNFVGQVVLLRT